MRSFILASGNHHKALEFKELLNGVLSMGPAPLSIEVEENGETFTENAFLKARAYYDRFKVPTLADDSGLTIPALPDILGVQSARFAPELTTYRDKCLRLLKIVDEKAPEDRMAYFTCVLCFYICPEEVYFFEGRVHGLIGKELKGEGGFGYDPIFLPDRREQDGKSLADLPEWKNEFSHRAKAVQSALQFFKETMDKTTNWP